MTVRRSLNTTLVKTASTAKYLLTPQYNDHLIEPRDGRTQLPAPPLIQPPTLLSCLAVLIYLAFWPNQPLHHTEAVWIFSCPLHRPVAEVDNPPARRLIVAAVEILAVKIGE